MENYKFEFVVLVDFQPNSEPQKKARIFLKAADLDQIRALSDKISKAIETSAFLEKVGAQEAKLAYRPIIPGMSPMTAEDKASYTWDAGALLQKMETGNFDIMSCFQLKTAEGWEKPAAERAELQAEEKRITEAKKNTPYPHICYNLSMAF